MYTYKETRDGRYVLSVDNHQEITAALAAFCEEKDIRSGNVPFPGSGHEAICGQDLRRADGGHLPDG